MRQNDEQNSVTLTTTASTNFDSKTVVLNSGSVHDEPISFTSYPKQQQQVSSLSKTSNKLTKVANNIIIDRVVNDAEDEVMMERKQNMKQLKSIKGYLAGIKTGSKA
jgi:hypothetical protein